MPLVHEYAPDAPVAGPFNTRQARDLDTGNVGNALSRVGTQISDIGSQIHQRDAQSEISDLTAKMAAAHADMTDGLNDTLQKADPGDKTVADNFMQNYDDKMGELGDNLSTPEAQSYFQKANAQMRAHFMVSSIQGQATLAGQKSVDDYKTTVSNNSSALLNDPSSFQLLNNLHGQLVQNMVENGSLPSNKAEELTTQGQGELAKSAVRGWINLDPNLAKQQLAKGQWDTYFSGDVKYQLQKEADQGINAQRIEQNRQQEQQKQVLQQQQTATQNQLLQKITDGTATTKDIMNSNLEPFGSGSKEQMLKLQEQANNEKIKTDSGTYINLFDRIHAPDGDPKKITDENDLNQYLGNGLTLKDLKDLRTEVQGGKTQDGQIAAKLQDAFMENAKHQLTGTNPMLGIHDPQGDEQFQGFLATALPAIEKAKQAGVKATDLFDPKSPQYMGNMLNAFKRTPEQVVQSLGNQSNSNSAVGNSSAPSSTTTQSAATPPAAPSAGGSQRGGTPPPGLSFEAFKAWKAENQSEKSK